MTKCTVAIVVIVILILLGVWWASKEQPLVEGYARYGYPEWYYYNYPWLRRWYRQLPSGWKKYHYNRYRLPTGYRH